jgi:hypothetical protein
MISRDKVKDQLISSPKNNNTLGYEGYQNNSSLHDSAAPVSPRNFSDNDNLTFSISNSTNNLLLITDGGYLIPPKYLNPNTFNQPVTVNLKMVFTPSPNEKVVNFYIYTDNMTVFDQRWYNLKKGLYTEDKALSYYSSYNGDDEYVLQVPIKISVLINTDTNTLSFTITPSPNKYFIPSPSETYTVFCASGPQQTLSSMIPPNLPQIYDNSIEKFNPGNTIYLGIKYDANPNPTIPAIPRPTLPDPASNKHSSHFRVTNNTHHNLVIISAKDTIGYITSIPSGASNQLVTVYGFDMSTNTDNILFASNSDDIEKVKEMTYDNIHHSPNTFSAVFIKAAVSGWLEDPYELVLSNESNDPQGGYNAFIGFGSPNYNGVGITDYQAFDNDPSNVIYVKIQDPSYIEKFSNYNTSNKMVMGKKSIEEMYHKGKKMGKKQIEKMHYDEDCNECKDSNGIIVEEKYKKKYYKKNNYMCAFYIFIVILIIVLLLVLLC